MSHDVRVVAEEDRLSLRDRIPKPLVDAWPQIRAVLVLMHVLAVLMLAFPAPAGVLQKSAWKDPSVQAEFRIWTERANALGIDVTKDEFESFIWDLSHAFMSVRNKAIAPAKPYGDYLGVRQDWRMFSAPHRFPTRLHVEIEEGGAWRTLYVELSDEHRWNAELFEHHRVRRLLFLHGWTQFRRRFDAFADRVARQIAVEFPDATRARLSHFKYRSPTPAEARAGKWDIDGRFINKRQFDLVKLRAHMANEGQVEGAGATKRDGAAAGETTSAAPSEPSRAPSDSTTETPDVAHDDRASSSSADAGRAP